MSARRLNVLTSGFPPRPAFTAARPEHLVPAFTSKPEDWPWEFVSSDSSATVPDFHRIPQSIAQPKRFSNRKELAPTLKPSNGSGKEEKRARVLVPAVSGMPVAEMALTGVSGLLDDSNPIILSRAE
jgi:hypothetical protein